MRGKAKGLRSTHQPRAKPAILLAIDVLLSLKSARKKGSVLTGSHSAQGSNGMTCSYSAQKRSGRQTASDFRSAVVAGRCLQLESRMGSHSASNPERVLDLGCRSAVAADRRSLHLM